MPHVGLAPSHCYGGKAPQPTPPGSPRAATGCWGVRGGCQEAPMGRCKAAGRGGMRVLTWALPRGNCRMPRASQAGSRTRSIVPGLAPAMQAAGTRRRCTGSALLTCSRTPALAGIYPRRVPACLLFFPLAEAEHRKVSPWQRRQPLPSLPSPHIRGFGAFHVTGPADAGARRWLSQHLLWYQRCRDPPTANHSSGGPWHVGVQDKVNPVRLLSVGKSPRRRDGFGVSTGVRLTSGAGAR